MGLQRRPAAPDVPAVLYSSVSMPSLLAHLVPRFSSHPENIATEALHHILSRSDAACRGFVAAIVEGARSDPLSGLHYVTQAATEKDGRPDLAGVDDGGTTRLLVEAKFWAGFTDKQPVAYLDQLQAGGVLLVVGPRVRLGYLWRELSDRLRQARREFDERSKPDETDGAHMIVAGRHLVLASWQRILSAMQVELAGDAAALADVAQLLGLCERMDTEAFLPVTESELSSKLYRRVHEFGEIVDAVASRLASDGVMSKKGLRATGANGWYGRYAWLRGVGVLLHVSTHKWTKLGSSPLWLTVFGPEWHASNPSPVRKQLAAYEAAAPGSLHQDYQGFPTVMLRVPAGGERHEVEAAVVEQIRRVGEVIASLGTEATDAAPPSNETET